MRAGGPIEKSDHLLRCGGAEAAGFATREEEGCVIDENRGADAVLTGHDVVLHEAVEESERGGRILAGKRQVVVVVREREGRTLPAVFKSESAALGFITLVAGLRLMHSRS